MKPPVCRAAAFFNRRKSVAEVALSHVPLGLAELRHVVAQRRYRSGMSINQ
jgi:hypothetical protein